MRVVMTGADGFLGFAHSVAYTCAHRPRRDLRRTGQLGLPQRANRLRRRWAPLCRHPAWGSRITPTRSMNVTAGAPQNCAQ
jgi:hypothetical protein